jgi:hypothetical protein
LENVVQSSELTGHFHDMAGQLPQLKLDRASFEVSTGRMARLTPAHLKIARAQSGITLSLIEGEPGADFPDLGTSAVVCVPSHSKMDQAISSVAIRSVLRFSLKATSKSSILDFDSTFEKTTADRFPIDENDPRIRKLVEQILFSRRFVLTYYLVLGGILVISSAVHLTKEFRRRRRRWQLHGSLTTKARHREEERGDRQDESGGLSSRHTLEGTASPPYGTLKEPEMTDENCPLLQMMKSDTKQPPRPSIRSKMRGYLMYQPAGIPAWNARFPSNATSLVIAIFVGINTFYLFYHIPLTLPMLFAFANRAGLVFVANLPILYLLSAKNQPLKWLLGLSYESLNIFHRRLGELMVFLALLHTLGMFGVWYTLLQRVGFSLSRFLASKVILLGIFLFITYETIFLTSTGTFRQKWYELFLGLHVVLQVAALVLLWFHHYDSRFYVGAALIIFCVDRLIVRLTLKTKTIKASLRVLEDGETVQMSSDNVVDEGRGFFDRLVLPNLSGGWEATDHVFVTVPPLSRTHIIQAHPFTIASRAPSDWMRCFRLLIRAQDGFSKDLLRYARAHDSVMIRVDGPYGAQSPLRFLQDTDIAIVVAGGSGIAVGMPLVLSLINGKRHLADPENTISKIITQRILLVWVIHNRKHFSWADPDDLGEISARGVETLTFLGRRDIGEIIDDTVQKHQSSTQTYAPKIGVVVSGPDGMNRDVRNSCAALASQGHNISVEVEKYGW